MEAQQACIYACDASMDVDANAEAFASGGVRRAWQECADCAVHLFSSKVGEF